MPRTLINTQIPTSAGLATAYSAPDTVNGNMIDNGDGKAMMTVKNGGAGTLTITVQVPITLDGVAVAAHTPTVPAGGERDFAFNPAVYNQPASSADSGRVYLDFSTATSITLAVKHHATF